MIPLYLTELLRIGLFFGLLGLVITTVATAVMRHAATAVGLVDHPDGRRKTHQRPTPLGGGVALLVGASLALVVGLSFHGGQQWREMAEAVSILPLAAACLWIVLVGLVDDKWGMRGRYKLLAQLVAALFLVASGFYFQRISLFGTVIDLGIFAVPFVAFWLVGAMNSVNLLDGADGFAGTIGFIMTVGLAMMAAVAGREEVAIVAWTFAGALLGFLMFNFPPAKIFLGDAGSMLVGLVVGALSLKASLKGAGTLLLAAPLALWAIPIIDVIAAILRRTLTGRSIYSTDRAHIHHRILERLGSNHLLLFVTGGIALICAAGALGSVIWSNDWVAVIAVACVVAILVVGDLFGRGELYLLFRALWPVVCSALGNKSQAPSDNDLAVHIQGIVDWESLWDEVRGDLQPLGLEHMQLDVNIPALGEAFHGRWPELPSSQDDETRSRFQINVPLFVDGQEVGSLYCEGKRNGDSDGQVAARLFSYARTIERRIAEQLEVRNPAESGNNFARVSTVLSRSVPVGNPAEKIARRFPR